MTRQPPTTETHVVLRTILSAGVLAVLLVLACAGRCGRKNSRYENTYVNVGC
ncbi:MAG: hypothetical protein C5S48_06015 [Candidatus Methanogaster sp.]|nr:MAG: hypothetical protein C5S48_06015 [ANME-2 cluster archaeon]